MYGWWCVCDIVCDVICDVVCNGLYNVVCGVVCYVVFDVVCDVACDVVSDIVCDVVWFLAILVFWWRTDRQTGQANDYGWFWGREGGGCSVNDYGLQPESYNFHTI